MNENREDREIRKIQFTGKSSYTLNIPKKWIEALGIKAGESLLLLKQSDNSILLIPSKRFTNKTFEAILKIEREDKEESVIRKLISLYLIGYNYIKILSKDRLTISQKQSIKETVRRRLMGTEIIEESLNSITLQVLFKLPELDIKDALKRMHLIALSMHRNVLLALEELNYDLAKDVIAMDDEVDRFNFYIIRQLKMTLNGDIPLKEMGFSSPRDCLGYRIIAKSIERIADHSVKIANSLLQIKEKLNYGILLDLKRLSDLSLKNFEDSMLSLFKRDLNLADEVINRVKNLHGYGFEIKDSRNSNLVLIYEGIRRISEYSSDIAEIVINLGIEEFIKKDIILTKTF
ncbi:MAG: phosphate uptake regulator PhoU [Nitrososphaerales archaeon]